MKINNAYLAGLFDGEGYLSIRRSNKTLRKSPCYRLVLGISNTNLEVLIWIKSLYGGFVYPKSRVKLSHKSAWEWTCHKKEICFKFLNNIFPYSKIKKERCILGLEFLKLKNSKRIGKWPIFVTDPKDLEIRENFKIDLSRLNQRGIYAIKK